MLFNFGFVALVAACEYFDLDSPSHGRFPNPAPLTASVTALAPRAPINLNADVAAKLDVSAAFCITCADSTPEHLRL